MKCEHCGNAKVWVGSMHGGGLVCEHCINDDSLYAPSPELMDVTEALARGATVTVLGGGGSGGGNAGSMPLSAGAGGGGSGRHTIDTTPGEGSRIPVGNCDICAGDMEQCIC